MRYPLLIGNFQVGRHTSVPPLRGVDFQGIGVYRSMSPPGYPSTRLVPSGVSFCFTRPNQFSTAIEESPSGNDGGGSWSDAS
jgi:hypothetical protein